MNASTLDLLRNRTFDEIAIGDSAALERTVTAEDLQLFAVISGDLNPQHLDATFAASTRFFVSGVGASAALAPRPSPAPGAEGSPVMRPSQLVPPGLLIAARERD